MAVTPAFHWNKKHWSDVYYEQLDNTQIEEWIKESYRLVASSVFIFLSLLSNLYSHFAICSATQDGMAKRHCEVLLLPQTLQRINHALA